MTTPDLPHSFCSANVSLMCSLDQSRNMSDKNDTYPTDRNVISTAQNTDLDFNHGDTAENRQCSGRRKATEDGAFQAAVGTINDSSLAALATRYKPCDQTLVFFAAARRVGQDAEAMALCKMLAERGIDINHGDELNQTALFYAARQGHANTIRYLIGRGAKTNVVDKNGETALFFAVLYKRTAAVKALLEGGAPLEVVNKWKHTCMSVSPAAVLPVLKEERKKRRCHEESGGPGPKRRRTPAEELRAWADEWPIKERVVGKKIDFRPEDRWRDVVAVKRTDESIGKSGEYAVLRKCPEECAARLRVSEKEFVHDHAVMMKDEPWFGHLKPEDVKKLAVWGKKTQHTWSQWQKLRKVHKSALKTPDKA
eukprot:s205_g25.t1